MKLASWNVNGLRSVHKKDFLKYLEASGNDILCLQEIKVSVGDVDDEVHLHSPLKYGSHWHFAEKAGYSGLVTYSKQDPVAVRCGLGIEAFDREGRWLECDFRAGDFKKGASGEFTVINSYWPNSQRDHARLPFKLEFCSAAEKRLEELRKSGKQVLICGDFNIAHKEIDLKNPKSNKDNAGFLPEERAWMDHFVDDLRWVDTFRKFEPGPEHYTWWSYRPGVREKNVGWRLDYFFTNPEFADRVKSVKLRPDVFGSDHCPVEIEIKD